MPGWVVAPFVMNDKTAEGEKTRGGRETHGTPVHNSETKTNASFRLRSVEFVVQTHGEFPPQLCRGPN